MNALSFKFFCLPEIIFLLTHLAVLLKKIARTCFRVRPQLSYLVAFLLVDLQGKPFPSNSLLSRSKVHLIFNKETRKFSSIHDTKFF